MQKLKKTCLCLLAAVILLAAVPMNAVALNRAEASGEASREGWTAISTAEEFLAMESGKAYYLTNDIDFGGKISPYLVEKFTGMLDGCGYALKNFTLANEGATSGHMGVFSKICDGDYTSVINLSIGTSDAPISMTNTYAGDSYNGFLAGQIMSDGNIGVFDHITVYGEYVNKSASKYFAGGLFGYAKKFVMTNCAFHGSLTDEASDSTSEKNLGGLVGLVNSQMNRQNVMTDCANYANVTAAGTGTSVRAGGLVGFSGSPLKMENCSNTGNISSSAYAGGLVGVRYASDLYIRSSESSGTVNGTNAGKLLGGSQNSDVRYLYIVGCGTEDTAVAEVSTLADLQGMTEAGKVYRLANDLDLEGKSFENFVFSGADGFRGVFDGNGFAVYNFTVNGKADSDCGFFNYFSKNSDTLITNLKLGTDDQPVLFNAAETGGKNVGVLAAYCNNNSTYSTLIDRVQIHVVVTHTGGKANIGGVIGTSRRCAFTDCSVSGNIGGNLTSLGSNWINIAGFVADVEADQTLFYQCVNGSDISVNTTAGTDVRTAGFVGYATKNNEFVNCANLGSISVSGGTTPEAAGFQANNNGTSKVLVYGCTNFGKINSGKYASGFLSWAKNPAVMMDSVNFGDITGTDRADAFYNDNTDDAYTVVKLGCSDAENDLNFAMLPGASVRLNAPAGLRFAASVNTDGVYYSRLLKHLDLQYGMMIAPTVFVTNAGGFTREKLDAYATEALGYTGEQSAYVTVDSTGAWYRNLKGTFAGSLVNIQQAHYRSSFSGIAYLGLTVNGVTLATVYAADPQARSVNAVAGAALNDVLYQDAEGKLYTAEGNVYDAQDASDYIYTVETGLTVDGIDGTVSKVSPYSAEQREVLEAFCK